MHMEPTVFGTARKRVATESIPNRYNLSVLVKRLNCCPVRPPGATRVRWFHNTGVSLLLRNSREMPLKSHYAYGRNATCATLRTRTPLTDTAGSFASACAFSSGLPLGIRFGTEDIDLLSVVENNGVLLGFGVAETNCAPLTYCLGFFNCVREEVRLMATVAFVRREIDFFGHA